MIVVRYGIKILIIYSKLVYTITFETPWWSAKIICRGFLDFLPRRIS